MLNSIHIRNFVIVKEAEINFKTGFTVLSGQTGTGKSILIDALSLALGGRSNNHSILEGEDKTEITALFDTTPIIQDWLQEHGYEDSELILRRILDRHGKSRAYINGTPTTLTELKELATHLVDIHGQHAHQSLLKTSSQLALLDSHAGINNLTLRLQNEWKAWQQAEQKLHQAHHDSERQQLEQERLEWQLKELEALNLKEGEWEQVNLDFNRLSHSAGLLEGAGQTLEQLDAEGGILDNLNQGTHRIEELIRHDPALSNIYDTLENARIACNEAVHELNSYLDGIELEPAYLEQLEHRLRQLFDTAKKFKLEPESLYQQKNLLVDKLNALQDQYNLEKIEANIKKHKDEYYVLATEISKKRQKTAETLSKEITKVMQSLAMQGGQFSIDLLSCEPTSHGVEQVQFKVAGHSGVKAQALQKVASGGELARISLALSVVANKAGRVPTLIFDEVDTGVGGAVAEMIGKLLRELGQKHQVLCVTHLAQVAVCAHHHYEVKKTQNKGKTRSQITPLSHEQKIQEIARMMGGMQISETTLDHAKELLLQYQ